MLASEDRATVNKVWSGQVPTCFKLAEQDCGRLEAPDPFYIMLPRISYLPFFWEKVQNHFSRYVASEYRDSQLWLETPVDPASVLSGSVSLRWHLPIGVLYDLHGGRTLPWTIIVHFRDFPEKELIPCPSKQVAEAYFMNSVKEADFLKTRKKVMTAMTQSERRQMTASLYSLQAETFWAVNRKLMFMSESWKHIPLRVFLSQPPTDSSSVQPTVEQLQKLVPISGPCGLTSTDGESEPLTLRQVLLQWLQKYHSANGKLDDSQEMKHVWEEDMEVILHGIHAPLDVPLSWLSVNMSYADNFLYVVVRKKKARES
ncbi:autophagy protein 5-like [Tropilaelaps mercedesae]|uniref:Autophagy protein 5 n=1 Tax=Tropilaelaps mercedesae TaxID=418985 RepID=A0A1V9XXU2_9ACAR|nr:autophagy protein 5-like [Tropilaelaps mercedesae]